MSLEIRKNSGWPYGVFVINGKKTVVNLGVPVPARRAPLRRSQTAPGSRPPHPEREYRPPRGRDNPAPSRLERPLPARLTSGTATNRLLSVMMRAGRTSVALRLMLCLAVGLFVCLLASCSAKSSGLHRRARADFEWFSALGFPDVKGCPYLRLRDEADMRIKSLQHPPAKPDPFRRFGESLEERAEVFALAWACWRNGLNEQAQRLYDLAKRVPARIGGHEAKGLCKN